MAKPDRLKTDDYFDTKDKKFTVYARMSRELINELRRQGHKIKELNHGKTRQA